MPQVSVTNDSPLISVLVTSYNHAPFIRPCIDSLLNQTYPNFHIQVVDDCSTDGTADVLRSYGDRIELTVRSRNLGVEKHAETINEAIRTADGYFFYRIDSDDFIEPDYFEQMITAWRQDRSLDWICGGLKVVDRDGAVRDTWDYRNWPTDPERAIARGWQSGSVLMPHNGLLRTDFLRDNNVFFEHFPYGWGEDVLFTIKGMLAKPRIHLLTRPGFNWRTHGENNSCDVLRRLQLVLAVKEYYVEHIPPDMFLKHPLLASQEVDSPEYLSAVYLLAAADLYVTKHRFTVPDMFMRPETKEEIEKYRPLFDAYIRRYAERSLEYSERFGKEVNKLLRRLENDQHIVEGKHSLRLGDFRAAEAQFSKVLAEEPKRPDALRGMGEAAFGLGCLDDAARHTRKALEIDNEDPETHNNLGVITYTRGDLETANKHFTAAVTLSPHDSASHLNVLKVGADISRTRILEQPAKQQLLVSAKQVLSGPPAPEYTALLALNQSLRTNALEQWKDLYDGNGGAVVLHHPPNGALKYLMESWAEVLTYMGIPAHLLSWGKSLDQLGLTAERTIFITVADPAWQAQTDWDGLTRRHRDGRIEIGLITTLEHRMSPVDFYITFHLHPEIDRRYESLDRPLIALPFAINPLRHYMRGGKTVWDYFFVGTNSHLKQAETEAYLLPLIDRCHGILAGARWTTGIGELSLAQVPSFYNLAAICPNYHLQTQIETPHEVNERTFIIPACGGFELVDNPAALSELFTPEEIVSASSPAEYHETFDYFLRHPEARMSYIEKGMRRVWRDYTLFHVLTGLAEHLRMPRSSASSSVQESAGIVTS